MALEREFSFANRCNDPSLLLTQPLSFFFASGWLVSLSSLGQHRCISIFVVRALGILGTVSLGSGRALACKY